jgi:dTDP-4-dehydrorhamnose reductase
MVITGAGGQVGRFLAAEAARRGGALRALTSADCDITDPGAVEQVVEAGDLVINCAAYTDVDAAEGDEATAYAVNVTGPGNIARACARAGAEMIHISTDYVFSGSFAGIPRPYELDDATGPLSVYGRTKLAGELAVLAALPAPGQATVVRTSWVYTGGTTGGDFVAVMRQRAARGESVEVVADQIGSPTYVGDLVSALLQVAGSDFPHAGAHRQPILHAANDGTASRFDQAREVYATVGADPGLVRPVSGGEHPRPAARPVYSALGNRQSTAAGLTPLRSWRDALHAALSAGPLPSTA